MRTKHLLLFFFLIMGISSSFSQGTLPNTLVSTSIGVGPNYGGIGSKTILGYKNSGVLIGAGYYTIGLAFELGMQFSYRFLYINAGYAPMGFQGSTDGNHKTIYGTNITSGVMISLGKHKRVFIDLGYGYSMGKYINYYGDEQSVSAFMAAIGIGYRLFKMEV